VEVKPEESEGEVMEDQEDESSPGAKLSPWEVRQDTAGKAGRGIPRNTTRFNGAPRVRERRWDG